ncbi:MAG: rod shape-determining protein [Cyclobacteriaceae bacterium]|nr:rod shape-determining protein [Cyclobacteriaceae bacterium]
MIFSPTRNLAIDLGNNNTLLSDQHTILLSEPSVMVMNEINHKVEAIGEKAYEMFEKTHENLRPVKPLRGGVISDGESAKKMMKEMVHKIGKPSFFTGGFNYLISGVPFDTTPVEKRALRDTLEQFTAQHTHLVHEPLAAALGMGLNIQEPEGKLVVDIGGGITEVVVISLSGIAAFQSIRVAGDAMDEEIQDYFRRVYNLAIGLKTAEAIKKKIGCVFEPVASADETLLVKGKDLIEGVPVSKVISQVELSRVLERPFKQIEECIHQSLEICPPELAGDIYKSGIHVSGGNSVLKGLPERFAKIFKLPVHVDPKALYSVSNGVRAILSSPAKYKAILM